VESKEASKLKSQQLKNGSRSKPFCHLRIENQNNSNPRAFARCAVYSIDHFIGAEVAPAEWPLTEFAGFASTRERDKGRALIVLESIEKGTKTDANSLHQ